MSNNRALETKNTFLLHYFGPLLFIPETENAGKGHIKQIHQAKKGYFHLCPRMDFLQTLHINNSLYTNYKIVFIKLDSLE